MVEYKIYRLIDPRDQKTRYIGLTFNTLKQRLKSHRNEKSKSHKSYWINSLIRENIKPIIELIEGGIGTHERACEREIYWINKYREDGHDLTNSTSGGDKNKKMSDETRLKMSESARNRSYKHIFTEESKKRSSDSAKSRMSNPKEIEKLRISNKRYEDSKTEEQKIQDILIQNCKGIVQYDKQMNEVSRFISIRDAERKTNIVRSNISKCCKLKVKSAGGFIWRYI